MQHSQHQLNQKYYPFFGWGEGTLPGRWDLSSPTRDQTHTLCTGNEVLTIELPGKSPKYCFLNYLQQFSLLSQACDGVFLRLYDMWCHHRVNAEAAGNLAVSIQASC